MRNDGFLRGVIFIVANNSNAKCVVAIEMDVNWCCESAGKLLYHALRDKEQKFDHFEGFTADIILFILAYFVRLKMRNGKNVLQFK